MDEEQNRFLDAMEKLIEEEFPIVDTVIHKNMWGDTKPSLRILIDNELSQQIFVLSDTKILHIRSMRFWRFDIANPRFKPETIIKWMKHKIVS